MEASSVKEHSVSKSSCSPIDLRSIELVVDDDKQEPVKCNHFTIRGYVAEIRKKDPKICWPFSTLCSYNPSEDSMLLPPLSMTKFRRWDCETCWATTISSSSSAIENRGPMNAWNDELKSSSGLLFHNTPVASYRDSTKLFSGLPQPYEENALERRSNTADGYVDFCNSEYHPSFCCGNKENESDIAAELTKEGLQMYGPEHIISYENPKQRKDSVYIALEGNIFGTEKKEETSTVVGEEAYVITSHAEDAAISTKENEVISISGIASAKMCENVTSKSANVASVGSEDEQLVSRIDNMKEPPDILSGGSAMHVADRNHDSNGVENNQEASETDLIIVNKMSQNQNNDTKLEKGERNTVVGAKAYVTSSHTEDAAIYTKENEVISIPGISSAKVCGNLTSKSTNVASVCSKADQRVSRNDIMKEPSEIISGGSAIHIADCNHESENNQEASETDLIMVNKMSRNQNNDTKLEILSKNLKHRKVRKVRLLNDIMRNENIYMPVKVCTFKGETSHNKNVDDKMEARPEGNARNLGHGRPCVSQKKEAIHSERKKKNSAIQNDDREDFQMHRLKKMSTKRAVTPKRDIQSDDCYIEIPKPDAGTSAGKDPSQKIEVHKVMRLKQEAVAGSFEKFLPQMKAGQPHLSLQQDSNIGKGNAPKSSPNGHIPQKSVHSPNIAIINEKFLQHDLKIQDRTHQKNASSNKKRKVHQVVDDQSYGMRLPEGKVIKKRRTTRIWDKRAVDDIPMDIVELLANNLQQKRMMNIECATKSVEYLSQVTDNLKEGGVTGVAKHHGNERTKAVQKELIQQRSQADIKINSVCVTGTSHENAYDLPKVYRSSTISDQDDEIYLNQQKMTGPFPRFNAFSHNNVFPMSREELRATVQYENSFPQMFCHDRSNLTGQMISHKNFGKAYDTSTVLLSGETSKMNDRNIKPNLNHVNMDSTNNSLKRNQRSVHITGWQGLSNPPVKHPLSQEIPTTMTSILEIGNGCHSNATFQADQYASGNILALNFPAVWSGGSFHALSNTKHTGIVQQAHLYSGYGRSELLRSDVGVNNTETIEHQINSCKPVRPVPRIGLLGDLLQKEIATRSGNFRPPSVIEEGCSTQMVPPNFNGSHIPSNQFSISRADNSKWVIPTVDSTSHPECSRTSNGTGLDGFRNNDQCVQPWRSRFSMEICTINRNPADFTLPDEGSVYMRGGLRTNFLPTSKRRKPPANREKPKQKKVRKLNALKHMTVG